jgi:4-amino-4-deoxy-L-arabinose transferase-like glycosyltransferase
MFYNATPWYRYTIISIVLAIIIHFVFGFILGLSVDEAHYALYGLHLDWSYFDHPPLVGWIQSLPVHWNWPVGLLRLIPEALWLISLLMSLRITQRLLEQYRSSFDYITLKAAMFWTSLIFILAPIMHVLGVGLLPDTLLLVLVPAMILITLNLKVKLDQRKPQDLLQWTLLGIVLGLSGLAKYTALFFALAIPFCLISWHGLKIFKRPGLYLCLIIAAILIAPVLYWNYQHDWISFIYQFGHGTGNQWQLKKVFVFILNQLVTYGFLIILGIVWRIRKRSLAPKVLLSFFLIPFVLFAYFSGGGGSLPHWTAPAWLALAPIAGIGLAQAWDSGRRFWIGLIASVQLLICTLGFTLLFFGGIPQVDKDHAWGKKNPIADLYGWQDAAQRMRELSEQYNTSQLAVQNWTLASRLAWYAKPLEVFVLDERVDQFDLWSGPLSVGSDALLLDWSQMSFAKPVSNTGFESCELIDTQAVHRLGRDIAQFDFLLCKNWQGHISPQRLP